MPKGKHADKGRNHCLTHQQLDYKAWNTKEKTGKKGAGQDFMVAKKIWRDIKKSADKLCAPGQKPFLIWTRLLVMWARSRKPN